jgi:hypothetical protein
VARNYKRDSRGRFARVAGSKAKKPSKRYARIGAVAGGTLMLGGPAYIPIGVAVGYTAGRSIDSALRQRRR